MAIHHNRSKARVLLVDDHAVVRAGIADALADLPDIEIVGEVGEGAAIYPAIEKLQPDCLLLDVAMPNFDPIAAIKQIRARYPNLKILIVSAHDDDVYVQGLLGAGVDGYHLKDQSLSDLRLAVQHVLAGGRWLSSPLVKKLVQYRETAPTATPNLTSRQRELLRCLQQGLDNQTIAQQMGLSVKTIENHLTRLYRQINVQSRLEAVSYISRHTEVLGLSEAALTPAPMPHEASTQTPIVILLVDDNARYRNQLRRMINHVAAHAVIHEAATIREAVRIFAETAPHLALVDVVLGDEDGIRCVRQLKAFSPTARIVLISAYPDREFHRSGLEAGAVAFLDKKDLDAAALRQVIADIGD